MIDSFSSQERIASLNRNEFNILTVTSIETDEAYRMCYIIYIMWVDTIEQSSINRMSYTLMNDNNFFLIYPSEIIDGIVLINDYN